MIEAEIFRAEGDIGADGRGDKLIAWRLKHHPDAGPGVDRGCGGTRSVYLYFPRIRFQQRVEVANERRLAAAVRTGDDDPCTILDCQ
ncbi:MAG: hypothetical protein A07HN63_01336 [uncultured archaeon A07HN63]|nr:MAG: hypothetical protein A07HN63_01336 [uncultured archaeon A07HN63]